MIIDEPEHLNIWLTKELGPICDADPASLAKYVIALIRKPDKTDEQLKEFCLEQLDAFLQSSTQRFVDRLFQTLKDKLYIPQLKAHTPPPESKREAPVEKEREKSEKVDRKGKENDVVKKELSVPRIDKESSPRVTKTRTPNAPLSGSNERQRDSPRGELREAREPKREELVAQRVIRKRISPPAADRCLDKDRRRRSRSPRDRRPIANLTGRRRSAERHREARKRSRSRTPERHEARRDVDKKKKQRCRDFDEKGYCMSGDQCQFDHGPDPVVVDDQALEKMVKMPKTGPTPGPGPNFSLPPPGYNPMGPQPPPPGIADPGYNPEAPALSSGPNFSVPPPSIIGINQAPAWRPTGVQGYVNVQAYDPSASSLDPSMGYDGVGPMRGMRGRGRGRGLRGRGAPYGGHPQRDNTGKSLEVRKIPPEFNNIAKLNEHFAKFGSIVNLQVHYEGDPEAALVTYSSRGEANNAYKSTEPILNNRFIKVFWHQPTAQQTTVGETKTAITPSGAVQRTVLNSGLSVERPVPVQLEMVKLQVPQKETIVFPSKDQTTFRNPAVEEEQKKKAEAVEMKRKLKNQQKQWLTLSMAKSKLIDKLLGQQKTAISLARKADTNNDLEQKKKAMKMLTLLKEKLDTERGEVQALAEKLHDYHMDLEKEAMERADTGVEHTRETPSPGTDEQVESPEAGTIESGVDEKSTVVVRGFEVDKLNEVTALLLDCGEVSTANITDEGENCACLVSFTNAEAAQKAVSLDGSLELEGHILSISWPTKCEVRENTGDEIPVPNAEDVLANLGNSEESDED